MKLKMTHDFDCDMKEFMFIIQNKNVLEKQMRYMKHLGGRRVVAYEKKGHLRHRTIQYRMANKFPGIGQVILVEDSTLNTKTKKYEFTVVPKGLENMVKSKGVYTIDKDGEYETSRTAEITVKVMVQGMDGILGKMMMDNFNSFMEAEKKVIEQAIDGRIDLGPKKLVPPEIEKPYRTK